MKPSLFPNLGFGVGLRHCHFDVFLKREHGSIAWVEALTENYISWEDEKYRRPYTTLMKIRENLPVVLHGVSLSIGSADPLDRGYLKRLKDLASRVQPQWISDHLCWTSIDGENLHDLMPLPYTEEAIDHVVQKVSKVQDFLGRRILLENVSSYAEFEESEMTEWEFLSQVVEKADCGLLLDINNIYVSSYNHGFDPYRYLKGIPSDRVGQIHLAGHTNNGNHLIDTHDAEVCDEVWDLYRWATENLNPVSTMVEWDDHIPEFKKLEAEVLKAKEIFDSREPMEVDRVVTHAPARL